MASTPSQPRIRLVATLIGLVIIVAACTSPSGASSPPNASTAPIVASSAAPAVPVSAAPRVPGY